MAGFTSAAPIYPGSCRRHCLYEARGGREEGRVGGGRGVSGGGLQCVASLRLPVLSIHRLLRDMLFIIHLFAEEKHFRSRRLKNWVFAFS